MPPGGGFFYTEVKRMTDNHQRFLSHLRDSKSPVWVAAYWLNMRGHSVTIPPSSEAESHAHWRAHADRGDLFIDEDQKRIEVKCLSVNFTSPKDWPFGNNFIVCAKHSFRNASPQPLAYMILSQDWKTAAVADVLDRNLWHVEKRIDRRYQNVSQEFYMAPLDTIKFLSLDSIPARSTP